MASFVVDSLSQTSGRALAATEFGFVSNSGTILTVGVSVTMDGQCEMTVLGDVVSTDNVGLLLSTTTDANITVGAEGTVLSSDSTAILGNYRASLAITNAGTISGDESAIALTMASDATSGIALITNNGIIRAAGSGNPGGGAVIVTGQADTANRVALVNTGTITHATASAIALANTAASVTNSGTIIGDVFFTGLESDVLRNTGTITGLVAFADTGDRLANHGTITGDVRMGVKPNVAEPVGDGVDRLVNTGLIDGDVFLLDGNDTFINRGGDVTGIIYGGRGSDTFVIDRSDLDIRESTDGSSSPNDLVISTASFTLREGIENLTLEGPGGLVGRGNSGSNSMASGEGGDALHGEGGGDIISGNGGNDSLFGGRGDDGLIGGEGDDLLDGGRDNDFLTAISGNDTMLGAAGNDTLNAGIDGGTANGGTGFDHVVFPTLADALTVNLATGTASSADGTTWTLVSIESIQAVIGNDTITGSNAANRIEGFDGNDVINGGAGNDTLLGDDGQDTITGGAGADTFLYRAAFDSFAATPDLISDFSRNADVIDLSAIDPVFGGIDDPFAFIGTADFAGTAPQVRFIRDTVANLTTVEVRLGGSAATDMVILLTGAITLTAENFNL